ncbi:MAG: DUF721 domain-containing protein [Synergistaceae bacterium]|nr:DUF721 domain-containing protein [Synergistaceae bacterium]
MSEELENFNLNNIFGKILSKHLAHQAKLRELLANWAEIVGSGLAKHSAFYDLSKKILYVCADSSAARFKIMSMRNNIKRIIKAKWDLDVEDIRVAAGNLNNLNNLKFQDFNNNSKHDKPVILTQSELNYFKGKINEKIKADNLNNITPETAEAIARLRAVYYKKFNK